MCYPKDIAPSCYNVDDEGDSTWSMSSSSESSWDNDMPYPASPSPPIVSPPTRKVRFQEDHHKSIAEVRYDCGNEEDDDDDDDPSELWYTPQDFKRFKTQNLYLMRRILRGKSQQSAKCIRVLQQTYAVCCAASETKPETFTLPKGCQRDLDQLCRSDIGLEKEITGLESFIIRLKLQDGRKERLQLLLDAVSWFPREEDADDDDEDMLGSPMAATQGSDTEELRLCCETISFASRLFAHHLAQARSKAAQSQQEDGPSAGVCPFVHEGKRTKIDV